MHGRLRRVDRSDRLWLLGERFVDRDGPVSHYGIDGYQYYVHGRKRDYVRHRVLDEQYGPALSAGSSTTAAPELQQYVDAMNAFGEAFNNAPDSSFLKITDPAAATAADVKQVDDASAFSHKAQDQLLAIKPPALVAALHSKVVTAFQAEVKTRDEFISALKSKDAAKMKSAHDALVKQADDLTTFLNQVMAAAGGQ